ncbi:dihydroorotate dehydrogenase electron transfer subunit [Thermodesulfovibrionales bacterium]|nr:dihydroorotate dehydrogenase electron transfer subunit [Thermodesulfovibrionales bacterium]MCL0037671.1 dihydroorotate dehydrogenase electron transfer subunit [Thermodesulfovibrionales bacterium]MCL0040462.1 dihydroorotate dehydrogenase electron transfer subunit [Thermodesulfovibrionales bacterium]MCL0046873.1 dihydroorotate dehydrogenase electron transfer subunit [Thermodesulfovibrionales bacterium]MCL0061681.1 dihydroorotate dehydrogenase electron transfer subunit [Thermodesulfovibrionales
MSEYFKAAIIDNISLNEDLKLLTITPLVPTISPGAGQFYMLQVGNTYDPLLKRPFSIFRSRGFDYGHRRLEFLYKIRGKGTLCLSNLKKGDDIYVIGPIGNGYPVPKEDFVVIAGGMGIASLYPILERLKKRAYLFYGARNKDELIILDEVMALSKEIIIATDDGSVGQKGVIIDVLKSSPLIKHNSLPVYACGPALMLKGLSMLVKDAKITCYVSLDEYMACGVGACLGCVVKVRSQKTEVYKRICKEGPVFDLEDIVWD